MSVLISAASPKKKMDRNAKLRALTVFFGFKMPLFRIFRHKPGKLSIGLPHMNIRKGSAVYKLAAVSFNDREILETFVRISTNDHALDKSSFQNLLKFNTF